MLADCVDGRACRWLPQLPFGLEDARAAFEGFAAEVELGDGYCVATVQRTAGVVGTVQVVLALPPELTHPPDRKLLVHRSARRRGRRRSG